MTQLRAATQAMQAVTESRGDAKQALTRTSKQSIGAHHRGDAPIAVLFPELPSGERYSRRLATYTVLEETLPVSALPKSTAREIRGHASAAGTRKIFVPTDNVDTHVIDFYRAPGTDESPVTFFSFTSA